MLKKIRTILAVVCFALITLLFLDFTGTLHCWLSWLAKIQFLPAVMALNVVVVAALIILTLVFGRIYCSVICPLGVFQDLLARFHRKKNKYSYSKEVRWLRYPVLAVFVIAGLAGIGSLFQLLAPYSSYGRIATMIFQPIWKGCNNLLAMAAEHYESYAFYSIDTWVRSMPVLIIAAITLVVLFVLAWRGGRTYCNTICPVGTILSFFSRFSWLKVHFDTDKCKNCSMCSKNCKAACIDYKTHTVDYSRCVVCGNCIDKCKFGALSYSPLQLKGVRDGQKDAQHNNSVDASKRSFLIASTMVTTAAFAQKKEKLMDGGLAEIEDKVQPDRQTPLTPPGSLSLQNLSTRCTGCQLCVSECPNQVLRPSNDLLHLMQAIKPLDDIEKSSIQIGHAVWIKKNCVVLTDEVECGNCARHCPSGAIEMVPLDENNEESPLIPAINESACIGCGACEYVCPSRPFSAIYVEGHEVHKKI